jgi:hypothetical protein
MNDGIWPLLCPGETEPITLVDLREVADLLTEGLNVVGQHGYRSVSALVKGMHPVLLLREGLETAQRRKPHSGGQRDR